MMYCFYLTFDINFMDGTKSVYEARARGKRSVMYVSDVENLRLAVERKAVQEHGKEVSAVMLINSHRTIDDTE